MSLRARITAPEERGGGREDGHLVATYRAKLLEEIDLAEMSSLAAADRRAAGVDCDRLLCRRGGLVQLDLNPADFPVVLDGNEVKISQQRSTQEHSENP